MEANISMSEISLVMYTFLNSFMLSGLFYLNSLDRSISNRKGVWLICIITMFYRFSCNQYRVDPDQTPRSAASDLDLHCLPMSLLWDARHEWVKTQ